MSDEEQVITILVSKKPFEKWLKGFEPEEVVGIPGSCSSCPIAKFVRQQGSYIQVFPYGVGVFSDNSSFKIVLIEDRPNLNWVAKFVKAVDVTTTSDTISSATALKVLESLNV